MKTIHKILSLALTLAVMLMTVLTFTGEAFGANGIETSTSVDTEDFNLVLLIDRSGSMQQTDRSELVKDAAKLFVDLCDESSKSQIAVMSFNTAVNNSGLVTIDSEMQRTYLKNQISAITYDNGGTDLGLALKTAVEYLKVNSSEDRKNLIVLFTDGYTQDLVGGRTVADSEGDLDLALQTAAEDDCRIYVIGANYNGSMTEAGKTALNEIRDRQLSNGISDDSGALLTIIDAKNQDGMQQVVTEFEKIYAAIGNRIIHTGDIEIESPNVTEVNIIITSPTGVSHADVTAPSGNLVSLDLDGKESILDEARIVYKAGRAYQLIKIVEPIEVGTWLLHVTDKQSEPILSYSWMLTTKTEIRMDLQQQEDGDVSAVVTTTNGDERSDADFYNNLTEQYINVTAPDGTAVRYELVYNAAETNLAACFTPESEGQYIVSAYVTDGYFLRTCSGTITVEIGENAGGGLAEAPTSDAVSEQEQIAEKPDTLPTISVWKWFSSERDLAEETEAALVSCQSVEGGKDYAELSVSGTILQLKGVKAGSAEIIIYGRAADGSEIILTGTLKVRNTLIPVIILLLLIVLVSVWLFVRSKRNLRGHFYDVQVRMPGQHSERVSEMSAPRGRVFSMCDIVRKYSNAVMDYELSDAVRKELTDANNAYAKELKKTKITVGRDCTHFTMKNGSYKVVYTRKTEPNINWTSKDGNVSVSFSYCQ